MQRKNKNKREITSAGRLNFVPRDFARDKIRVEKKPEILVKTERQKKHADINLRPLKSIFYLILFLVVFYFFFLSSVFKIKNVEIDGVKSIEISDFAKITLLNRNIILLRPGSYLDDLAAKFPVLEEAQIVRGLPNTIKIFAKERKQVMVWCSIQCFEIDNRGFAYQEVARPTDKVVLVDGKSLPVKIGDQVVTGDFINFYLSAIDRVNELGVNVIEANVDETTFKVSLKTSDNWSVILDTSASLKNQISALKQVLEKNRADIHEYVDVRVEGTVYIK